MQMKKNDTGLPLSHVVIVKVNCKEEEKCKERERERDGLL